MREVGEAMEYRVCEIRGMRLWEMDGGEEGDME